METHQVTFSIGRVWKILIIAMLAMFSLHGLTPNKIWDDLWLRVPGDVVVAFGAFALCWAIAKCDFSTAAEKQS